MILVLRQSIRRVVPGNNNVQTYFMDGETNCSFGLYYASLTASMSGLAPISLPKSDCLEGRVHQSSFSTLVYVLVWDGCLWALVIRPNE